MKRMYAGWHNRPRTWNQRGGKLQQATTERLHVEEQLVNVQKELQSGKGDKAALEKRREEILRAYKTAYTNESDKKAVVQSKTGRVVVVWDSGGTRR